MIFPLKPTFSPLTQMIPNIPTYQPTPLAPQPCLKAEMKLSLTVTSFQLLFALSSSAPILPRTKRSSALIKPIAKKIPSVMAKTFAIGGEAFKAYKDAAAKEASSGGWMTDKFEKLVFTPTVNILAQEIKSLEALVKANNEEKTSYLYATLSLSLIHI